jgi:hypothetical protein
LVVEGSAIPKSLHLLLGVCYAKGPLEFWFLGFFFFFLSFGIEEFCCLFLSSEKLIIHSKKFKLFQMIVCGFGKCVKILFLDKPY